MNRKPKSLRRTVALAALRAVLIVAAFAVGFIGFTPDPIVGTPFRTDHAAASTAAVLVEAHGCWTGTGPEGVIPGHVVVTRDGRTFVGGPRVTGQALEQIFDGADHGLSIHGFCY